MRSLLNDTTISKSRVACEQGFTLFEVLIAMAILALALPILLGLRNWDLNLHSKAGDITAATLLAQEKLIEAELSPVFPLGETSGAFQNPPLGYQILGDTENRADKYRWKRIVTTTPLPSVREVKIQILWEDGAANEQLEVSTYVFAPTTEF
ncbi:MAG TPA: prepilin-type N-terminal cleavage/methylation domain-containing protein [Nitrospira sp.]|nr:prepilin-type N-terminal cleavage/methylation domain-containing protein [Nitrospira sp.]